MKQTVALKSVTNSCILPWAYTCITSLEVLGGLKTEVGVGLYPGRGIISGIKNWFRMTTKIKCM